MALDIIYRRAKSRRFQISLMLNKYRCLDFRLDTNHLHIWMLFTVQFIIVYPRNPLRISRYVLPLQTAWLACRPCKKKWRKKQHSRSSKLRCLNRVKRKKMIILDVSIGRGKKPVVSLFLALFTSASDLFLFKITSQLVLDTCYYDVGEMLRHFLVSIMWEYLFQKSNSFGACFIE